MNRLVLRRETLAALGETELADLRGGTAVTSLVTCLGCITVHYETNIVCVSVRTCPMTLDTVGCV